MKKTLVILLMIISINSFSQDKKGQTKTQIKPALLVSKAQNLVIYLPSGEVYSGKSKTINQLNNELAPGIPIYVYTTKIDDKIAIIGYMLFFPKYYWIMLESPDIKEKALKSFNLEEFFGSDKMYTEIENAIDKKNLTGEFLNSTLGEPRDKTISYSNGKKIEIWTYKGFRLTLTLVDGVVTKYIRFVD